MTSVQLQGTLFSFKSAPCRPQSVWRSDPSQHCISQRCISHALHIKHDMKKAPTDLLRASYLWNVSVAQIVRNIRFQPCSCNREWTLCLNNDSQGKLRHFASFCCFLGILAKPEELCSNHLWNCTGDILNASTPFFRSSSDKNKSIVAPSSERLVIDSIL